MFPSYDQGYQSYAHLEGVSNDSSLDTGCVHSSNLENLAVTDFWFGTGVKTEPRGMFPISGRRGPFQIGHGIVDLDCVNVVDLRQIVWIGNECQRHQSMNEESEPSRSYAQHYSEISLASASREARLDDLANPPHRFPVPVDGNAIDASNASGVANFVTFTELGDGDTPPFFDEHKVGPFARSAHFIASFSAHQGD